MINSNYKQITELSKNGQAGNKIFEYSWIAKSHMPWPPFLMPLKGSRTWETRDKESFRETLNIPQLSQIKSIDSQQKGLQSGLCTLSTCLKNAWDWHSNFVISRRKLHKNPQTRGADSYGCKFRMPGELRKHCLFIDTPEPPPTGGGIKKHLLQSRAK